MAAPSGSSALTYFHPVKSRAVSRNCRLWRLASAAVAIRVLPEPSPYTHTPSQLSPAGMGSALFRLAVPPVEAS